MLRDVSFAEEYRTGENDPLANFFRPALQEATIYWLAAGYFSSRLFDALGDTLGSFVRRGGAMRLVTSVHLSQTDLDAIEHGLRDRESVIADRIKDIIAEEFSPPLAPGAQLVTSMLKTRTLEIKLATRVTGRLYHEKLGILFESAEEYVAFSGSVNATQEALLDNFESIDVYTRKRDPSRSQGKRDYFKRLWEGVVPEIKLFDLPDGLKEVLIRRYDASSSPPPRKRSGAVSNPADLESPYSYQDEAVEWFLDPQRANGSGVLWMATGTGKTITALKIINRLFEERRIDAVVISTRERLLAQWDREMKKPVPGLPDQALAPWRTLTKWQTATRKDAGTFRQLNHTGKCLLITYSFLPDFVSDCSRHNITLDRTLIVVDEVHNIGSEEHSSRMQAPSTDGVEAPSDDDVAASRPVAALEEATLYATFGYRLGLSATPFSDYDDDRNQFIANAFLRSPPTISALPRWALLSPDERRTALQQALVEHGGVFYFGLEDGISRGILAPFDYIALPYVPTPEEKAERVRVMRLWQAKVKAGEASAAAPYIHMAKVFKASEQKLSTFAEHLRNSTPYERARITQRAVMFVENMAFGTKVAEILHSHGVRYHTFFSGGEEANLTRFGTGDLDVLITCHMISEGIDIRTVSAIILFASDRQRLETIQRIGRALRVDPRDPQKVALVVDFVYLPPNVSESADLERMSWLQALSTIRPGRTRGAE